MSFISEPQINATIKSTPDQINTQPKRVLFLGQKTSAGSAASGSLVQNIQNDGSEDALFGTHSQLTAMIRAYKKYNEVTQLDVIPLSDAGGAVSASSTITFTGTATESGTLTVNIGSRLNNSYVLNIDSGDTAASVAAQLESLIDADDYSQVNTGSITAGALPLTAFNAGLVGNSIGIECTGSVAGISVAITAFSSGATNPTLTGVFDVVGDVRYQTIVQPSEYGASNLTSFLDPRFNSINAILDGVGIMCMTNTYANLATAGEAQNSRNLLILGNQTVNETLYKGSNLFELNYVSSAQFAALRMLRLTNGADISPYVTVPDGLDQVGGDGIAGLPYAETPFQYLPIIDQDQEFTSDEVANLNTAGITVFGNNDNRSIIVLGRAVTTYKTNSAGQTDSTFHYLNAVDESVTAREVMFNRSKQDFAQKRLTTGDVVQNRSFANVATIRAAFILYYTELSGPAFAITVAGNDALNLFIENLRVSILSVQAGTVSVSMKLPIVSQLRQINEDITVVFNINN